MRHNYTLRLSKEELTFIEDAAKKQHSKISQFIRFASVTKAFEILNKKSKEVMR